MIQCTRPVSCFLEQFGNGYISFIFQVVHNFLFTICKCNIQETGITNKIVLYCFCSFYISLQDERYYFKVCKKSFERGVIKKSAMIVSYERTNFFFNL